VKGQTTIEHYINHTRADNPGNLHDEAWNYADDLVERMRKGELEMMRSLLEKYQMGMITDDHLVVESLHMVDPENPGLVLSGLPDNILHRMLKFANEYLGSRMVTNYGVLPAQDQVLATRDWIEMSVQQKANQRA
jgi:hypothetical protein